MSRIFTIVIDDETFEDLKKEIHKSEEFSESVLNQLSDTTIVEMSIPFYITHIEEDN
jgi:hypothetical protein